MKIGDVVKLKSGGPAMTITFIDSDNMTCEWFDKNDNKILTVNKSALDKLNL